MSCTVLSATLTAAVFMRSRLTKANIHIVRLQATNLLKKTPTRFAVLYVRSELLSFNYDYTHSQGHCNTNKAWQVFVAEYGATVWQNVYAQFTL